MAVANIVFNNNLSNSTRANAYVSVTGFNDDGSSRIVASGLVESGGTSKTFSVSGYVEYQVSVRPDIVFSNWPGTDQGGKFVAVFGAVA